MSPFRILAGLAALLAGTIWCDGTLEHRLEGRAGSASAQTPADQPASFTGSLVELPPLGRLLVRQAVYVPAYSTIRLGSGKGQVELATTLSIHNTSEDGVLVLLRADYFNTSGKLIHSYVPAPIAIRPLGTVEAFVRTEDTRGGTGANFVVEWAAEGPLSEPAIEAIMVGSQGTQGYSFTSPGKRISVSPVAR